MISQSNVILNEEKSVEISFIERFQRDHDYLLEECQLIWYEYLKFICLKVIKKNIIPSITIDLMWHKHLTYTMNYHRMCHIVGKYIKNDNLFIHHNPTTSAEQHEQNKLNYARTLQLYEKEFCHPFKNIWESLEHRFSIGIKISTFYTNESNYNKDSTDESPNPTPLQYSNML